MVYTPPFTIHQIAHVPIPTPLNTAVVRFFSEGSAWR